MVTAAVAQTHQPVMVQEVVQWLNPARGGLFVDATAGAGGHAAAILAHADGATLVAIDRDPAALLIAAGNLAQFGQRVRLVQGDFRNLRQLLASIGVDQVDGVVLDAGVSSMQLDNPERGFTYTAPEAPLDMRMDPAQETTAARLLNQADERELGRIIREYGEERWASRIASFVVQARARREFKTAGDLVDIIRAAIPAAARRSGGHPARRTFQALRIAVNDELTALAQGLDQAAAALRPGGRLVAISFHSLEDRLVKLRFRELAASGYHVETRRPVGPTEAEVNANPRSRSAKMRVLTRTAGGADAAAMEEKTNASS